MQATAIISQSPPTGQPAGQVIPLPVFPKPLPSHQAQQLIMAQEESLQKAAMCLILFKRVLRRRGLTQVEFERAYDVFIIHQGLHVWLTPGDAADLWAAIQRVEVGQ